MKLRVPAIYSQRDSRWANIMLGYNTNQPYTIGNYGCLITSFGNYINKTPIEVNTILKSNNGFISGGGDLIWSKVTALGLQQVYQSPYYSAPVTPQGISKMKSLLDEGKPLVCHVDFNPTTVGDEMHWVLVYGYEGEEFFIVDPWTGSQVSLDIYGGAARAVLEWRAYDKNLPSGGTTIPVDTVIFENLVRKSTTYDKVREKLHVADSETVILAEIDKLITFEDAVRQKDRQLEVASDTIRGLEEQIHKLQADHELLSAQNEALVIKTDDQQTAMEKLAKEALQRQDKIDKQGDMISSLQDQLNSVKNTTVKPVFTGIKKIIFDLLLK